MQHSVSIFHFASAAASAYSTEMTGHWDEFTDFALKLARAAAEAILPHFRQNTLVHVKRAADWDPVTEGDRAGERAIRQLIEQTYPSHGIIGEEYGEKPGTSGLTWILDPVDGTRAFVIGLPTWATLIALYEDGVPRLGVMSQPFIGDMFYGNPSGAWLDHRGSRRTIRVNPCSSLRDAKAGTTAPHLFAGRNATALAGLQKSCQLTRFGLDAYSYCLLASGHLDIALDPQLQIYDIAALIPIIHGAGGVVGSWSGHDIATGGDVVAAASAALLEQAVAAMQGGTVN